MDRPADVTMHFDGIYGYQRLAHKQTDVKCAVGKKYKVSLVVCVQVMLQLLQEKRSLCCT